MAKLSEKRRAVIYGAVHGRLMDCRIEVARMTNGMEIGARLDAMIARAQGEAASAAVKAAEGESGPRVPIKRP